MRKNAAFSRWLAFLLTLLILSAPVGCAAGERVSPGAVSVTLDADGTGRFAYGSESAAITWDCDESDIAWITLEDGRNYYMTASTMSGEVHRHTWLLLELEERLIWLH